MFRSMKTLAASLVTLTMLTGVGLAKAETAAKAQKAEFKVRWLLAHEPVRVFERAAKQFKNEVESASQGKIEVEVLTVSEYKAKYGIEKKFVADNVVNDVELLKAGGIEMTQTYTTELGHLNPKMWVLDLPFLFRDHAHAKKVMDGEIGQKIMAGLLESDVRGLAFTYSGGYRIISTRDKPLTKVEDFKNLTIRTARSPVAKAMFTKLGAEVVPMNHDAGIQNVKRGSLMATETTVARFDDAQREATPIFNDTQHSLFLTSMVVNEKFFAKLPPALQDVIRTAAKNAAELERQDSLTDEANIRKQFASSGMKIVSMDKAELKKMKTLTTPLYNDFKPMFGADLIQAIEQTK
ncbi:MAG: TRAP transporter substrate-binding protein [Bdellovibrionales bacterium]|nr:TRAP transporter substrate-binding protein [Bdellovibrionales bacterium]